MNLLLETIMDYVAWRCLRMRHPHEDEDEAAPKAILMRQTILMRKPPSEAEDGLRIKVRGGVCGGMHLFLP